MKAIFLGIAMVVAAKAALAQKGEAIVYSPLKKLQWNYFKGAPQPSTSAAAISTKMVVEVERINIFDGRLAFKVYAVMQPALSWVRPYATIPILLQHEQTHFDITALCAKALQDDLNKAKIKGAKSPLIKTLVNKWEAKLLSLQKQYDQETKHGTDFEGQVFWTDKIVKELNIQ